MSRQYENFVIAFFTSDAQLSLRVYCPVRLIGIHCGEFASVDCGIQLDTRTGSRLTTTQSMPQDLYALDDQLAGLLQTESFQGKFDVTAFVESLSARQLDIQQKHPEDAFEPKPLVRDFETALQRLNVLKTQVNEDIDRHAKDAQLAEMTHENKIRQLNQKFEVCIPGLPCLTEC